MCFDGDSGEFEYSRPIQKLEALEAEFREDDNHPLTMFNVDGVDIPVWTLMSRREAVTVVKAFMPAGVTFPRHSHEQRETLTIYEGRFEFYPDVGDCIEMGEGDSISFASGEHHRIRAITDCWFIAVQVPDSEDFNR